MASIQEIKRRIKAVTSTGQITKAMELVSATKMRRSQEVALTSRPYAMEAYRILAELRQRSAYLPALMQRREIKKTAVVLVASDRGLAGSFNANVFRVFEQWFSGSESNTHRVFIAVGKKAEEFLVRKGLAVHQSFKNYGDHVEIAQVEPLTRHLVDGFLTGVWDEVVMVSTHFRTTLKQEVFVRELLPIDTDKVRDAIREIVPEYGRYADITNGNGANGIPDFEYLIDPDPQTVMDALAPQLLEIVLYDFILEANASEHSARMVAMKSASDNAAELRDTLTVAYNKVRQGAITREISEIVSGAEALS